MTIHESLPLSSLPVTGNVLGLLGFPFETADGFCHYGMGKGVSPTRLKQLSDLEKVMQGPDAYRGLDGIWRHQGSQAEKHVIVVAGTLGGPAWSAAGQMAYGMHEGGQCGSVCPRVVDGFHPALGQAAHDPKEYMNRYLSMAYNKAAEVLQYFNKAVIYIPAMDIDPREDWKDYTGHVCNFRMRMSFIGARHVVPDEVILSGGISSDDAVWNHGAHSSDYARPMLYANQPGKGFGELEYALVKFSHEQVGFKHLKLDKEEFNIHHTGTWSC